MNPAKAWRGVGALAATLAAIVSTAAPAGPDDLAWLEEPRGARALAWTRERSRVTRDHFLAQPAFERISADLERLASAGAAPANIALLGDKAVRFVRDARRPHGVLQVAPRDDDGMPTGWQDVLDVDRLRRTEGKPYVLQWDRAAEACLPPAYDRCILRLSPGGGDAVELREFDLRTRDFPADGFLLPAALAQAVWLDASRLLVTHTLAGAPRTAAGLGAAVHAWQRGKPIAAAPVVFRAEPGDMELFLSTVGLGPGRLAVVTRAIDYSTFSIALIDTDGRVMPVGLPARLRLPGVLAATDRHFIVQTTAPSRFGDEMLPAESVLSYDVTPGAQASGRVQVVHVPFPDEHVGDPFIDVVATRSRVHFVSSRELRGRLSTASLGANGWTTTTLAEAAAGSSMHFTGADPLGEDFVLQVTGYLQPRRLQLWRNGRAEIPIAAEPAVFDASGLVVEVRTAISRDGTSIPYYVVRPGTVESGVAVPTLMTGYGAFGIPLPPAYLDEFMGGRSLALWLARGGALVVPLIRGGGEFGSTWHHSAMRDRRQNSYDDFIAVAQSLVDRGFTRRDRLGVFGGSNGGLLAAVAGTQRPDLFGAVACDVPLADMLRFPAMGLGAVWIDEYGDPNDPAMAQVLRGYSPVHNIRPGIDYPPFLVTTSTGDDRVGPGHARKLVARLSESGATAHFIEVEEGGHGVSDPLARPDLTAIWMTFLMGRLMP